MHIQIRNAGRGDIARVARIFQQAFSLSVKAMVPNNSPAPEIFEDIFMLLLRAMPRDFFVAELEGDVQGYIVAPVSGMSRLWMYAVFSGTLLYWAGKWALGRYHVPVRTIPGIIRNKLMFVRTEKAHSPSGRYGRILSVAVAEAARGHGLGNLLVRHSLNHFRAHGLDYVKLEVRPDNVPAYKAYIRHGFVATGRTRDVQGEWLVMLLDLKNRQLGS